MIIGKYSINDEVYMVECDHEDYEYAIDDIISQLEDMTGQTISFEDIDFYSAKLLKIKAETKYTII